MKQIDPIYQAYNARIIKYLAGTDFYDAFMSVLDGGKNTFQFSNRKVEKSVDEAWVAAIEAVIKPIEEIIANPRNFIAQEEAVVNIALVKKVTPDSIRHLAQHGNMIDTVENGNVRPNRLMNKFKEDSLNTYENRFVCTLIDMAHEFVTKRYEAIFAAMGEEYGAFLKMSSDLTSYNERITANIDIRIRQDEDIISADEKNETIFSRIARLHRLLGSFRQSGFFKEVTKYGKIKPPLVLTNAIAKNPNFKACHKLWNFLLMYEDVGYNIVISEQSTKIDDTLIRDIYHSILFNYIILKNYLENPKDREIKTGKATKKTKIKPKFITEIIEEFVKNYDLPDVVVRKVLIEEITKAQLMLEEEEERRRLVEEKEKEMLEKKRLEEQEKERQAREAEKERQRREKELLAEQERQRLEQERREQADIKKAAAYVKELEKFKLARAELAEERLKAAEEARRVEERRKIKEQEEAARQTEELAKKRNEERLAKEKEEEEERLRIEKEKEREAALKAAEAEKLRLAGEKEKEKAAKDKAAALEKERLAKERAKAKEKAAREKAKALEKERLAKERAKAKEKAAREKAKALEKERLAKERAKAKEKAAREKAKALEKERLAKEKAKALEKERQAGGKAKTGSGTDGSKPRKEAAVLPAAQAVELSGKAVKNLAPAEASEKAGGAPKRPAGRGGAKKKAASFEPAAEAEPKAEAVLEQAPAPEPPPEEARPAAALEAEENRGGLAAEKRENQIEPPERLNEIVAVSAEPEAALVPGPSEAAAENKAGGEAELEAEEVKPQNIISDAQAFAAAMKTDAAPIEKSEKNKATKPSNEAAAEKRRGLGRMLGRLFRNQG